MAACLLNLHYMVMVRNGPLQAGPAGILMEFGAEGRLVQLDVGGGILYPF